MIGKKERCYSYNLYPTIEQKESIVKTIKGCQAVWNICFKEYARHNKLYEDKEKLRAEILKHSELKGINSVPLLCVRHFFNQKVLLYRKFPKKVDPPKQRRISGIGTYMLYARFKPYYANGTAMIHGIGIIKILGGKHIPPNAVIKKVTITHRGGEV